MVPKQFPSALVISNGFRAVLFRMVPKLRVDRLILNTGFRAVLFRMVPKRIEWDAAIS